MYISVLLVFKAHALKSCLSSACGVLQETDRVDIQFFQIKVALRQIVNISRLNVSPHTHIRTHGSTNTSTRAYARKFKLARTHARSSNEQRQVEKDIHREQKGTSIKQTHDWHSLLQC